MPGKPGCKNIRKGGDTIPSQTSEQDRFVTYVVYRSFKVPPPIRKIQSWCWVTTLCGFSGWILTPIAQSTNGYPRGRKNASQLCTAERTGIRIYTSYFTSVLYIDVYIIHNTDRYIMQVYMHALSTSETNQLLQHQPIHFCSCFGRHTSCTCWLRRPVPLLFVRPKTLWVMWAKLLPRTRVGCWIWPSVLRAIVKEIVTGCWWTNYTSHCQFHSTIWKKTRSWKFQFSECRTGSVFYWTTICGMSRRVFKTRTLLEVRRSGRNFGLCTGKKMETTRSLPELIGARLIWGAPLLSWCTATKVEDVAGKHFLYVLSIPFWEKDRVWQIEDPILRHHRRDSIANFCPTSKAIPTPLGTSCAQWQRIHIRIKMMTCSTRWWITFAMTWSIWPAMEWLIHMGRDFGQWCCMWSEIGHGWLSAAPSQGASTISRRRPRHATGSRPKEFAISVVQAWMATLMSRSRLGGRNGSQRSIKWAHFGWIRLGFACHTFPMKKHASGLSICFTVFI